MYTFIAEDGIVHAIWIINDTNSINNITQTFKEYVPFTYIADGHHRAASAAKTRKLLPGSAKENADFFLTTLFPANQLQILDYNRLLKNLNGLTVPDLVELLQGDFIVQPKGMKAYKPSQLHEFGLYADKKWYKLTAKPGTYSDDPVGILDVTILQNNVLAKFLNIHDQRTDKNIEFVGGIRGLTELEKRVNTGEMVAAFSLYPVSIEQLLSIADTSNLMPPKSTWFEPKLRDGLLTHLLYE